MKKLRFTELDHGNQEQFQTLNKATRGCTKKKERTSHQELRKGIHLAAV